MLGSGTIIGISKWGITHYFDEGIIYSCGFKKGKSWCICLKKSVTSFSHIFH